jgi:hypothetical protein
MNGLHFKKTMQKFNLTIDEENLKLYKTGNGSMITITTVKFKKRVKDKRLKNVAQARALFNYCKIPEREFFYLNVSGVKWVKVNITTKRKAGFVYSTVYTANIKKDVIIEIGGDFISKNNKCDRGVLERLVIDKSNEIHLVDDYNSKLSFCRACLKRRMRRKFQYCGRCESVQYCSRECQEKNWFIHKGECIKKEQKKKS